MPRATPRPSLFRRENRLLQVTLSYSEEKAIDDYCSMGRPVVVRALHHYCFALRSVVLAWLISSAEDSLAPMGRKRNEGGGVTE